MKIRGVKFFIPIAFLLGIFDCIAKNHPPVPNPNGKTNEFELPPPVGFPDTPIDTHLNILILLAILLGIYVMYKYHVKAKKTPK
jgi:hypothetical protein